jgi:hypothetical protein
VDTDHLVDRQRRGRAGRRGEGWVYTSLSAGTGPTPIQYPNYCRVIGEDGAREWIFNRLGIEDSILPVENPSPVDRRMRLDVMSPTTPIKVSLCAFWLLSCTFSTDDEAWRAYDSVERGGWPDTLEGPAQLLMTRLRETAIVPRDILAPYVAARPFVVKTPTGERRVRRLFLAEGRVYDM